jgi:hypothetical protein
MRSTSIAAVNLVGINLDTSTAAVLVTQIIFRPPLSLIRHYKRFWTWVLVSALLHQLCWLRELWLINSFPSTQAVKSVRAKFRSVCVTLLSSQLYLGNRTALRGGSVRTLRTAVFPYTIHWSDLFLNFMNLRETCNYWVVLVGIIGWY